MPKGSQLTQLKAALSSAGVTGPNQSKKRKRSAAPLEKDKEKRAAKLEDIHRRLNPFDVKVTKLKHDVGGRRLKGITGKPAQSKQSGIEQVRLDAAGLEHIYSYVFSEREPSSRNTRKKIGLVGSSIGDSEKMTLL